MKRIIRKFGKLLWDNLITILLLISMWFNFVQYSDNLRNEVAKEQIRHYQQIIETTPSMAIESATRDSLNAVVRWWVEE